MQVISSELFVLKDKIINKSIEISEEKEEIMRQKKIIEQMEVYEEFKQRIMKIIDYAKNYQIIYRNKHEEVLFLENKLKDIIEDIEEYNRIKEKYEEIKREKIIMEKEGEEIESFLLEIAKI